jgi:thiol-disulfide isomerase/thioredoxin
MAIHSVLARVALLVSFMTAPHALAADPPKPAAAASPAATPEKTTQDRMVHSTTYVNSWLKFPSFSAEDLKSGSTLDFKPRLGEMNVLIFIASWCEPCQRLVPEVQKLERKLSPQDTRFIWIFAHDTPADAESFAKEYKLSSAVLANKEILTAFNNPELPSIYVGDRRQWMLTRFLNTRAEDLPILDQIVKTAVAW